MTWRLAKSLVRLREQINEFYPNRDKESDGSIGDTAHLNRKSDHNPNAAGVVTAIDIDENIAGQDSEASGLVNALQWSNDPRIKYIIYEGRITTLGDLRKWKHYDGINPHKHHFHISVSNNPKLYDDGSDWQIGLAKIGEPEPERNLKFGDKGSDVRALQVKLKIAVDGNFGKGTKTAVMEFQKANGLTVDGVVGHNSRQKLGL